HLRSAVGVAAIIRVAVGLAAVGSASPRRAIACGALGSVARRTRARIALLHPRFLHRHADRRLHRNLTAHRRLHHLDPRTWHLHHLLARNLLAHRVRHAPGYHFLLHAGHLGRHFSHLLFGHHSASRRRHGPLDRRGNQLLDNRGNLVDDLVSDVLGDRVRFANDLGGLDVASDVGGHFANGSGAFDEDAAGPVGIVSGAAGSKRRRSAADHGGALPGRVARRPGQRRRIGIRSLGIALNAYRHPFRYLYGRRFAAHVLADRPANVAVMRLANRLAHREALPFLHRRAHRPAHRPRHFPIARLLHLLVARRLAFLDDRFLHRLHDRFANDLVDGAVNRRLHAVLLFGHDRLGNGHFDRLLNFLRGGLVLGAVADAGFLAIRGHRRGQVDHGGDGLVARFHALFGDGVVDDLEGGRVGLAGGRGTEHGEDGRGERP